MRRFLTASEIDRLDRLYVAAYAQMSELHKSDPLAHRIHHPKVPALLTESMAALHAPNLFAGVRAVHPGDGRHDLKVALFDYSSLTVAVKGTGPSQWVTLTPIDLDADALVWVDYTE